jgi:NarL family two-component system response regulator YdfI
VKKSNKGRILLVSADPALRTSLAEKLCQLSFEVVAEGDCSADALRLALQNDADVLVLDGNNPQTDAAAVSAEINRQEMATQLVLLGSFEDQQSVLESLQSGVRACVSRARALNDVPAAIGQLLRGYCYLSPEISNRVTGLAVRQSASSAFTTLEMEIAQRVARDIPTHEIARQLKLSKEAVKAHCKSIMQQLEANHIGGLLRHAVRHNFRDR